MVDKYRPKDWKTIPIWSRLCDGTPITSTHEAFEAGADAMLTALWKLAEEAPAKIFTLDANIQTAYARIFDIKEDK